MWDGPEKAKMRDLVIKTAKEYLKQSSRTAVESAFMLPGSSLKDVKQGLKEGIFDYRTKFWWAENNREYAQVLKFRAPFLKDNEGRPLIHGPKIYAGDVQKMTIPDIQVGFEFVHLDTCSVPTPELMELFVEVIGYSRSSTVVWMTLCRRYGPGNMFARGFMSGRDDISMIKEDFHTRLMTREWAEESYQIVTEKYNDTSNMLLLGVQFSPTGVLVSSD